jgi:hypothetical protein
LNDAFELPSLDQIEKMEKQRSLAIEALEISDGLVKCQKYGKSVPLLRTLTRPSSNRIDALQKQIHWIEHYRPGNKTEDKTYFRPMLTTIRNKK